MREKPAGCEICGAEAVARRECARCGGSEWVIEHRGHYKWGREVFECGCLSPHSALGRRMKEARGRQQEREKEGKRPAGRPSKDHPVTTPEMARKAAECLAQGLSPREALRAAGFPPATVRNAKHRINQMVRAELWKLGRKYMKLGRDLSPEDQEALVRGRLAENTIVGTDAGVQSARQLGSDRRVNMWAPDTQVGMIILQPPAVPKILHEVPLLHVEQDEEEEE